MPRMYEVHMNAFLAQLIVLARVRFLIALLFLASTNTFAENSPLDRQEIPTFVLERTELLGATANTSCALPCSLPDGNTP